MLDVRKDEENDNVDSNVSGSVLIFHSNDAGDSSTKYELNLGVSRDHKDSVVSDLYKNNIGFHDKLIITPTDSGDQDEQLIICDNKMSCNSIDTFGDSPIGDDIDISDDQRRALEELEMLKAELGYEETEPPEYNVKDRLLQLNKDLENEVEIEKKSTRVMFRDDPVDLIVPPTDYSDDENFDQRSRAIFNICKDSDATNYSNDTNNCCENTGGVECVKDVIGFDNEKEYLTENIPTDEISSTISNDKFIDNELNSSISNDAVNYNDYVTNSNIHSDSATDNDSGPVISTDNVTEIDNVYNNDYDADSNIHNVGVIDNINTETLINKCNVIVVNNEESSNILSENHNVNDNEKNYSKLDVNTQIPISGCDINESIMDNSCNNNNNINMVSDVNLANNDEEPKSSNCQIPNRMHSTNLSKKVLVECEGQFELMRTDDVTAKSIVQTPSEEETIDENLQSMNFIKPQPPIFPRPATANVKRLKSESKFSLPKSASSVTSSHSNSIISSYQSPYALSVNQKRLLDKQKEAKVIKQKLEQERIQQEKEAQEKRNADAFEAWCSKKRALKWNKVKKIEYRLDYDKPNPSEVFNSWLLQKKKEKMHDKLLRSREEEERRKLITCRSQEEVDEAIKSWMRQKNQEAKKAHLLEMLCNKAHYYIMKRHKKKAALKLHSQRVSRYFTYISPIYSR